MRKLLLLIFVMSSLLLAQTITPIHDVQYTTDVSGDSPLIDQVVTLSGVVTVGRYTYSSGYFFLQDAPGAWNGVQVYVGSSSTWVVNEGDSVQVTGTVDEYNGLTEITSVTDVTVLDSCKWLEPVEGTTAGIDSAEQFESVLVKVRNVTVTDETITSYSWLVDDGSGVGRIGTRADDNYYYHPKTNDDIDWIVGVAFLSSGHNVIEPRAAYDFGPINGITMIQSIQQVRECDVLAGNDRSYFEDDTVSIVGVVTVKSGLLYAGSGKKYYLQQSGGGDWSAMMVYDDFSDEVPTVFEGDSIKVTGIVSEYFYQNCVNTELDATEAISLLGEYATVPEPIDVKTSTFCDTLYYDNIPSYKAEKYENALVKISNVVVDSVGPYGVRFEDETGRGLVTSIGYSSGVTMGIPAMGTLFESVVGVIYHHFAGNYNLVPRYDTDIVIAAGPPLLSNTGYSPVNPQPEDSVTISTSALDEGTVESVKLFYAVNDGAYIEVNMVNTTGSTYEYQLNPFANGDSISFYVSATDNDANTSLDPDDAPTSVYSFIVSGPTETTIYDIQFSEATNTESPLKDELVKFTGVVTSDTSTVTSSFHVQDFSNTAHPGAAWNGIMVYTSAYPGLKIGDEVEIVGTVKEYYYLTEISPVVSVNVLSSSNAVTIAELTSAELAADSVSSEPYEGVLVKISDVSVLTEMDANDDWTVTDDAGKTVQINGYHAVYDYVPVVDDMIEYIIGNIQYSFDKYELIVRGNDDIGNVTVKIDDDVNLPIAYRLDQNYPNPFNPTTSINYGIEKSGAVTLKIYNILGQEIITLVDKHQASGNYTLSWNGRDKYYRIAPAGVYIYQIISGDFVQSKKMILLK